MYINENFFNSNKLDAGCSHQDPKSGCGNSEYFEADKPEQDEMIKNFKNKPVCSAEKNTVTEIKNAPPEEQKGVFSGLLSYFK